MALTASTQAASRGETPLLAAMNIRKYFPVREGVFSRTVAHVHAVDDVSLEISKGTTLGVVGESGCGKTTLGRTLLRLTEPSAGKIVYAGRDITRIRGHELRSLRQKMQIVFQDPQSSLNPRLTIRRIVGEPMRFAAGMSRSAADARVGELLERVGLQKSHADRYPHEFSGGQRQRIGIARALAPNPDFIVLDEPTSALDVSVQAQILNLLLRLQKELGLTYLFISHDLSVVRHMCEEIAVMYLGKIVERGPTDDVFAHPEHPYTQALFSAVPVPDPDHPPHRIVLKGDVPSPVRPPSGCRFHPRCPSARPDCAQVEPLLTSKGTNLAACFYPGPVPGDAARGRNSRPPNSPTLAAQPKR
ncbi:MAG: ABC transporter ATP-binding protein [Thermoplasmatota archaeon]